MAAPPRAKSTSALVQCARRSAQRGPSTGRDPRDCSCRAGRGTSGGLDSESGAAPRMSIVLESQALSRRAVLAGAAVIAFAGAARAQLATFSKGKLVIETAKG